MTVRAFTRKGDITAVPTRTSVAGVTATELVRAANHYVSLVLLFTLHKNLCGNPLERYSRLNAKL